MKKRFLGILLSLTMIMSSFVAVNAAETASIVSLGCQAISYGSSSTAGAKGPSNLFDGTGLTQAEAAASGTNFDGKTTGYIQVDLGRKYHLTQLVWTKSAGHDANTIILEVYGSNDPNFLTSELIGPDVTERTVPLYDTNAYRYVRIHKGGTTSQYFQPRKMDIYGYKEALAVDSIASGVETTTSPVVLTFNDSLAETVDSSAITVTKNGKAVEIGAVTTSGYELSVAPATAWEAGGIYKITVAANVIKSADNRTMTTSSEKYFAVSSDKLQIDEFAISDSGLTIKATNKSDDTMNITLWTPAFTDGYNSVSGEMPEDIEPVEAGGEYVRENISLEGVYAIYLFEDVANMKTFLTPFSNISCTTGTYQESTDTLTADYTDAGIVVNGTSSADKVTLFVTSGDTITKSSVKAIGTASVNNGTYAVTIALPSDFPSGEYNVWASDGTFSTPDKAVNLPFVLSSGDKQIYAEQIAGMSADELKDYFEYDETDEEDRDNSKILNGIGVITERPTNTADMYDAIAAAELSGTYEEIVEGINECIALEIAREKGISYAIENYGELLDVDEENEYYTAVSKESLFEQANTLMETDYTNTTEFNEKLLDSFKIVIFQNAASLGYATTFAEENNDFFGFDFDGDYAKLKGTQSQEVIKAAMAENTVEAMRTAFDSKVAYYKKKNQNTTINNGGVGTGTGSIGGAISTNTDLPLPEVPVKEEINFSDIDENHWAYESVMELAEKGIVNGTDGKFMPDNNVTREEFVKLLTVAANITEEGSISFDDVPAGAWYYSYVSAAKNSGIVNGISETLFGTGSNITRQDMSVMIYNTCKNCNVTFEDKEIEISFDDAEQIKDYAQEAVTNLYAYEIINGRDNNMFVPEGNATRAEAAVIICRMLNLIS